MSVILSFMTHHPLAMQIDEWVCSNDLFVGRALLTSVMVPDCQMGRAARERQLPRLARALSVRL